MHKFTLPKAVALALQQFVATTEAVLRSVDKAEVDQKVFDEGSDYETVLLGRVFDHEDAQAALSVFAAEFAMDPFEYQDADEFSGLAASTWRAAMDEYQQAVVDDSSQRGTFKERWEEKFSEAVLNGRVDFLDGGSVLVEQDDNLYAALYRPLGECLSTLTETYITPEEIKEVMEGRLQQAIEQESGGNPLVLLGRCKDSVEFSYTPAWGVTAEGKYAYIDDETTTHQGNVACVESMNWDKQSASIFTFFNIDPNEFLKFLRVPGNYSFMTRDTLSEKEINAIVDGLQTGMEGEFLASVVLDPAREPLCSLKDMCVFLDNAGHGGLVCATGKIAIRDLYSWDENRPAALTNTFHSYLNVGIHNFLNGSGHMEGYAGVSVPLPVGSLLQCRLSGREGYEAGQKPRHAGTDAVYGFARWGISLEQTALALEKQPETETAGPSL